MSIEKPMSTTDWEVGFVQQQIDRLGRKDVYLEIGSFCGGSMTAFGCLMAKGATLVGVEKPFNSQRGPGGSLEKLKKSIGRISADGFDVQMVFEDSRDPVAVEAAKKILAKREVDCLLIDAAHDMESVLKDAENYIPMVGAGGLVIFHDAGMFTGMVKDSSVYALEAINSVWQKYADGRKSVLVQEWCGYGLVWL